jgi:hypothetical protein
VKRLEREQARVRSVLCSNASCPSVLNQRVLQQFFLDSLCARLLDTLRTPTVKKAVLSKHVSHRSKQRHETPLKKVASSPSSRASTPSTRATARHRRAQK